MSARQKLEAQLTENNIVKEVRIKVEYKYLLHLHSYFRHATILYIL